MSAIFILTVGGGHAKFEDGKTTWTTNQASMKFRGIFSTGKVVPQKVYRQAPKGFPGKYVMPKFTPQEKNRLHHQAQMRFDNIRQSKKKKNKSSSVDDWIVDIPATQAEKIPHAQDLCERCEELGMCCVNFTKEVMTFDDNTTSVIHIKKHHDWHRRMERLESAGYTTLFHQTDAATAKIILATQMMKCGNKGALGGGIYFAENPEATNKKALKKGVILRVRVLLGNQKVLSKKDSTIDFTKLLKEGYDSVVSAPGLFSSGKEHVVYDYDQVVKIEKFVAKKK